MRTSSNTLEAVFTLPAEIFYPGAAVSACCMLFTLGKPHCDSTGKAKKSFFGYYKNDEFKKRKILEESSNLITKVIQSGRQLKKDGFLCLLTKSQ